MEIAILIVALLVLVFFLSYYRRRPTIPDEPFLPFDIGKQTLYWFVDSEPNARHWYDFAGRRSDTPNRGYLEVALEALRRSQGQDYRIVPLIGRLQTMTELVDPNPRAYDLPPILWRCYVIANLAAKKGGLVIDGNSVLTIGPSFKPLVQDSEAALFGVDHDEMLGSDSAPGPDNYIGYAASPQHPAWTYTLGEYEALVAAGPQAWTAAVARRMPRKVWETQKTKGMECIREADGSRLPHGQLRQLEDYFGRKSDVEDPKQFIDPRAVYVTYDGDALERRYEFNWFLRLSPKQLKETDLLWSKYAGLL